MLLDALSIFLSPIVVAVFVSCYSSNFRLTPLTSAFTTLSFPPELSGVFRAVQTGSDRSVHPFHGFFIQLSSILTKITFVYGKKLFRFHDRLFRQSLNLRQQHMALQIKPLDLAGYYYNPDNRGIFIPMV